MNPEFLTLRFRNFEFQIDNSHNSKVLYSKKWASRLNFLKQLKKIGIQNSYRNMVSENSIIFQYDIDLAHGLLYMCIYEMA